MTRWPPHDCLVCGGPVEWHKRGHRCGACTHKRLRDLAAIRQPAHLAVAKAIKAGLLPSLHRNEIDCTDCDEWLACQYDHRDYSKPLEVEPVCRRCNLRRGPAKQIVEYQAKSPKYLRRA